MAILFIFCQFSCGEKWLDVRRQEKDVVPTSVEDLQSVLDDTELMNLSYYVLGFFSSDDLRITEDNLSSFSTSIRNSYVWAKDIFPANSGNELLVLNQVLLNANIVIEKGTRIKGAGNSAVNSVLGQALFHRAFIFQEMATLYCKEYSPLTAGNDLGVCLKTTSDMNVIVPRSSVAETYRQIVEDLKTASDLLPENQSTRTRPSKIAAFALLSRIYLLMGDYESSKLYADKVLNANGELLDYNSSKVSLALPNRFPNFQSGNVEILFFASTVGLVGFSSPLAYSKVYIDQELYKLYDNSDLRKLYYFEQVLQDNHKLAGSYTGGGTFFVGVAKNEVYLTRSECNVRLGNIDAALSDINKLLLNRYRTGTFNLLEIRDKDELLDRVLLERRKELAIFGQLRWSDLKRLNNQDRYKKILMRTVNGESYILQPGDKRYIFPYPQIEIDRTGIVQNIR